MEDSPEKFFLFSLSRGDIAHCSARHAFLKVASNSIMCAQWCGRATSVAKFELEPSCVSNDVESFPKSFSPNDTNWVAGQRAAIRAADKCFLPVADTYKVRVGDSSYAINISITRRLVLASSFTSSLRNMPLKVFFDFNAFYSSCRFADRVRPSR